jgi:hypothetical protein
MGLTALLVHPQNYFLQELLYRRLVAPVWASCIAQLLSQVFIDVPSLRDNSASRNGGQLIVVPILLQQLLWVRFVL